MPAVGIDGDEGEQQNDYEIDSEGRARQIAEQETSFEAYSYRTSSRFGSRVKVSVGTKGQTTTFAVSAVKRVMVGRGWARKGLWLVIPPYVAGINKMAEGYTVSFEAPDGETHGDAVYALHMQTKEEAQALVQLLEGGLSAG